LAKDIIPPEYSLGAAAMGQGVKFAEKIFAPNPDKNKEKTFSLAAELRRNILALPRVHEMMAPIKTPH
jgi:hypothetical protein